jgi:hypothetical protein
MEAGGKHNDEKEAENDEHGHHCTKRKSHHDPPSNALATRTPIEKSD